MRSDSQKTEKVLIVKNFSLWNTEVPTLSDEKIIERSKIKVSEMSNKVVKVGKNRIEATPGEYMVDLVIKDAQGNVLDVKRLRVTVKSKKDLFFLFVPFLIFLALLGTWFWWFLPVVLHK